MWILLASSNIFFLLQGDLVWFDPGVGHVLPGEVLEFHRAAQVLTVQAVIGGKVSPHLNWISKHFHERECYSTGNNILIFGNVFIVASHSAFVSICCIAK